MSPNGATADFPRIICIVRGVAVCDCIFRCGADEAELLLSISAENRWNGKRRYGEIIQREQTDTETATMEQLQKIRELIQAKYLHPLSGNTLLKISQLSAKRLIWKGEMNRRKK